MTDDILAKICQCDDLPVLPSVAVKLLALIEQNDIDQQVLIDTIRHDPFTVTKILKAANSPIYGFIENVDTVEHAVNLLGTNKAIMLAITFSLSVVVQQRYPPPLDYQYFWKRSIISATAARSLMDDSANKEPVFLASLLQDIGVFFLAKALGKEYLSTIAAAQTQHIALCTIETRQYGQSHNDIGAYVLKEWHLPIKIIDAVKNSHEEKETENLFDACVAVSGWIADYWLSEDDDEKKCNENLAKGIMLRLLDYTLTGVDRALEKILDELPEVAMWFNDHELRELSEQKRGEIMEKSSEVIEARQ